MKFKCANCGTIYPTTSLIWNCGACGGPIDAVDLKPLRRSDIVKGRYSLWRYQQALVYQGDVRVSLGEGLTPLVNGRWGKTPVQWKCEFVSISGSFKDRGVAVMINNLLANGVSGVAEDSSGNGGAAVATYAAAAGLPCRIYVPAHTSPSKITQIAATGAEVMRISGSRQAVADAAMADMSGRFYASHNWDPAFLDGIKTVGYEIWEQSGFAAPDAIIASIGFALAVGVLFDAFVVRMTIVPAVMRLLGERAWYLPKWLDRILPSFDVEGEGLQRRLALADWPAPNSGLAVAAAGVRVQDVEIIGEQGIFVHPGATLALNEAHADRRTAILLALTGRTPTTAGRIKIGELVLPEEAPRARRRTAYVDAASPTVLRDLQRAVRSTPTLVALDHADRIPADAAGRVQVLLDALTTAGAAVVTSSSTPGSLPPAAPPIARSVVPPVAVPAAAPFELSQP